MTIEEIMNLVNEYGLACIHYGKHTYAFSLTRAAEDAYAVEDFIAAAGKARTALEQELTRLTAGVEP